MFTCIQGWFNHIQQFNWMSYVCNDDMNPQVSIYYRDLCLLCCPLQSDPDSWRPQSRQPKSDSMTKSQYPSTNRTPNASQSWPAWLDSPIRSTLGVAWLRWHKGFYLKFGFCCLGCMVTFVRFLENTLEIFISEIQTKLFSHRVIMKLLCKIHGDFT